MEFQRQSRLVLQLQSDIIGMMRTELSYLREGSSIQQSAGYTGAGSSSSNINGEPLQDAPNNTVTRSIPHLEDMTATKRLIELEAKLAQVQNFSKGKVKPYRVAVNPDRSEIDRDFKLDTDKVIDRLTSVLDSLVTELSEVRASQGGSTSQLMSQLRSIESKMHAQDLRSTQMPGGADLVRVGSFAPMAMGIPPPHLHGFQQAISYGGDSWALTSILSETVGLTGNPLSVDGEKDALLEQFISVGAPGALWHACNEIVDDKPLVHSQQWDRFVTYKGHKSSSQNEFKQKCINKTGGHGLTDKQKNGDTGSAESNFKHEQSSKQTLDVAEEFENSGCINEAQIKPSPLKPDKRIGELRKGPFVPKSQPDCSPKGKEKDDHRGPNSYSSTCKPPPPFKPRQSHRAGIEVSQISNLDPSRVGAHCCVDSKGTNGIVRNVPRTPETLVFSERSLHQKRTNSSSWKVATGTVSLEVDTSGKIPAKVCPKSGLVDSIRKDGSCTTVDQSGKVLDLVVDVEKDLDVLMKEMEQASRQNKCEATSTAPDEPSSTSGTPEPGRSSGNPEMPGGRVRRWSFPSFAFISSFCMSNLTVEQGSHMRESLNIHEQPVLFVKGKLHKRNHTEVQETKCGLATHGMSSMKSLEFGGQETIRHGSEANVVENPLFGKKWASLKYEGAVKESGNTRTNPLFDDDVGSDIDANGLPQYHAELSTQLVSMSALVNASKVSASLASESVNRDNQLQWTGTIDA